MHRRSSTATRRTPSLFDAPTQFSTQCAPTDNTNDTPPCYSPSDYDNLFRGPMTIRNALAQSINVPAIEALYLVGIQNAINLARSMGITTLTNPDQYGLTLVLGGGEVTLLDMVSAYGVIRQRGHPHAAPAHPQDRRQLGQYRKILRSVAQPRARPECRAADIGRALGRECEAPLVRRGCAIFFPGYHIADKTGTTNDTKDAWVIGYTPHLVVGAWAGNNDDTPMVKKVAGLIIVPMWHDFVAKVLATRPRRAVPRAA